jgi:hypothetical protein
MARMTLHCPQCGTSLPSDYQKRKRRWLSFSLSTLLIALTVFCVWLGWQVNIVRERQRLLGKIAEISQVEPYQPEYNVGRLAEPRFVCRLECQPCDVSAIRRALGDRPWMKIQFLADPAEDLIKEVAAAFPEAHIEHWPEGALDWKCYQRGCFVDLLEEREGQ